MHRLSGTFGWEVDHGTEDVLAVGALSQPRHLQRRVVLVPRVLVHPQQLHPTLRMRRHRYCIWFMQFFSIFPYSIQWRWEPSNPCKCTICPYVQAPPRWEKWKNMLVQTYFISYHQPVHKDSSNVPHARRDAVSSIPASCSLKETIVHILK